MTALIVLAIAAASILFHQQHRIHSVTDAVKVLTEPLSQASSRANSSVQAMAASAVKPREIDAITIASMRLGLVGNNRLRDLESIERLGQIVRRYDVIALQDLLTVDPSVPQRILAAANAPLDRYDLIVSPPVGRGAQRTQFAFLFDRTSVELDASTAYLVADPDDLLANEPFVVWGRVRGPEPAEAFTFTLINVLLDGSEADQELAWVSEVARAVKGDGRGEDDVILLGDFRASADRIRARLSLPGLRLAVEGEATDMRRTGAFSNIAVGLPATVEFRGTAGVFDFYNVLDLTMDEALGVSEHLPVWAEFGLWEGGIAGTVAALPESEAR